MLIDNMIINRLIETFLTNKFNKLRNLIKLKLLKKLKPSSRQANA